MDLITVAIVFRLEEVSCHQLQVVLLGKFMNLEASARRGWKTKKSQLSTPRKFSQHLMDVRER